MPGWLLDNWQKLHPPAGPTTSAAHQRPEQFPAQHFPWFSGTPYHLAKTPSVSSQVHLPATSVARHSLHPDGGWPFHPAGGHIDPGPVNLARPSLCKQSRQKAAPHCPAAILTIAKPRYEHPEPMPQPASGLGHNDRPADGSCENDRSASPLRSYQTGASLPRPYSHRQPATHRSPAPTTFDQTAAHVIQTAGLFRLQPLPDTRRHLTAIAQTGFPTNLPVPAPRLVAPTSSEAGARRIVYQRPAKPLATR